MALPRPRIPENQNVLFPVQKAAVQQRPELPGRFRRRPLEIESLLRLLQRQPRVFQQPLHPALPPLLAFPRDHFQQILLIAQRLSFGPPRRVFVALPHRRQVQILELLNQRRADVSGGAHCRTPISVHNWSKPARATRAPSTNVTRGMRSSGASSSPIDSPLMTASACLSSSARKPASTWTSPASTSYARRWGCGN